MEQHYWWCPICERRIRREEQLTIPAGTGLTLVNHAESIVRMGRMHRIRHTVMRRPA